MASITLSNLKKFYAKQQVLFDVNVAVEDGEFIVIVGPSGCGKSTLLRMVAGLETVSDGEIRIGDRRVNELEPRDRDIAMVFQNYALYPHMNVFDNMAYGLKLKKVPREDIDRRVRETADLLDLEQLLERKPRQLSGGQRQRVAMGRAIVREPSVFLFDEPLSNLDAKLRVRMRLEIRKLQRRLSVTSLYVTHDQVEAMTMADRLVVMNGGVVEQVGKPMALYERPETMFVAGFIGSPAINFVHLTSRDGLWHLDEVRLPAPGQSEGEVVAAIRPEHFRFEGDESCCLTLNVELVEPLGADHLIHGKLYGHSEDIVVRAPQEIAVTEGPLKVYPDLSRLMYFDPASKKRIG